MDRSKLYQSNLNLFMITSSNLITQWLMKIDVKILQNFDIFRSSDST